MGLYFTMIYYLFATPSYLNFFGDYFIKISALFLPLLDLSSDCFFAAQIKAILPANFIPDCALIGQNFVSIAMVLI